MKKYLLVIFVWIVPALVAAKTEIPPAAKYFMEHVKWYSEKVQGQSATMLTLDYPYMDFREPKDYFTFSVLKQHGLERPKFFLIVLGNGVDTKKGLSLYFFKQHHPGKKEELQSTGQIRNLMPSKKDGKFTSYLFKDMRYEGEDMYNHFRNKDMLIAVFYDKDGTENKVLMSYATGTFPEAYDKLK